MREATWRAGLGEFSDCLLAGLLVALASVPVVTAAPALAAGCRALDRSRRGVGGPLWTTFWADFRSAARGGVLFGLGCLAAVAVFAVDLEVAASLPGAALLRPVLGVLAGAAAVLAVRTCEVTATRGSPVLPPGGVVGAGVAAGRAVVPPGDAVSAGDAAGRAVVSPGSAGVAAGRRAGLAPGDAVSAGVAAERRALASPGREVAAGDAAGRAVVSPGGGMAPGAPSWRRAIRTAARESAAAPGSAALLGGAILLSAVLVWMLPILALVVAGPLCLAVVATGGRS
ncbi:DUF624 domain-containing protein [Amycolatopsis sp. cg9]|uniref:DUF624 domain-containing protein n=1 Tax=Amycolatopsis sp. cg9 TaxID=3238801 RepID=UPI003526787C